MAELLRGTAVAAEITESLIVRTGRLKERGIVPCLAILRVGERIDDLSYERAALKRAEKIGIRTVCVTLPVSCTQAELLSAIEGINRDRSIHGCLMFRPLPSHLDELAACDALLPEKDIDGMTVSMLLQNRDATVTMCHSRTADTAALCRQADILVIAAGKAGIVDHRFVHPEQIIVDVGVNAAPGGGICGDVRFDDVESIVRAISPVPGGVGSVTTAVLCKHVIEAAEYISA